MTENREIHWSFIGGSLTTFAGLQIAFFAVILLLCFEPAMADTGWCKASGRPKVFDGPGCFAETLQYAKDDWDAEYPSFVPCRTFTDVPTSEYVFPSSGAVIREGGASIGGCAGGGLAVREDICGPNWIRNTPTATSCSPIPYDIKNGKNSGNPENMCPLGNPINPVSGNKYQKEVDYRGAGLNPLRWERHYNSALPEIRPYGAMGRKWLHSYQRELVRIHSERFTLYTESGAAQPFYWDSISSSWDSDTEAPLLLADNGDGTYTVTREDGSFELYEADSNTALSGKFRLATVATADGFRVELTYDPTTFNLDEIEDHTGRRITVQYDSSDELIESITLPGGEVLGFEYNGDNTLVKVFYPDLDSNPLNNPFREYIYSEPAHNGETADLANLTGLKDELGVRFATWKYDSLGRATYSEHANGVNAVTISNFDPVNQTASFTDALGGTEVQYFELKNGAGRMSATLQGDCALCEGRPKSAQYDTNGYIKELVDAEGNTTLFAHDDYGRETCRVEGIPSITAAPESKAFRRTLTSYDPQDASLRTPINIKVYKPANPLMAAPISCDTSPTSTAWIGVRETVNTYVSDTGKILTRTEKDLTSFSSDDRLTTYGYYVGGVLDGLLHTIDGPRTDVSDVTQYFYATTSSSTHNIGDLTEIWDPKGHKTEFLAFDAHGRVIEFRDINSQRHYLTYDARGNLTKQQIGNYDTRYEYDNVGNLTKIILPDDSYTIFRYDAAHRLHEMEDNFGSKIVYTLDAMSNRVTEEVLDPSDTMVRTLARVYDNLNRLQKSIDGVGNETIFTYDANGNLDTTTNPKSYVTDNYYDALGRVNQVVDALSNSTFMELDVLDNVVTVTDPRGNPTTYTHNGFGDLMQLNSPDSGQSVYEYDSAGNRISSTDARGIQIGYQYDELNRLTYIDYPTDIDTQFIYDTGSAWQFGRKGRLATLIDESGTMDFRYDFRGNAKEVITVRNGIEHTMWYDHDNAERIKTIVYPSGRRIDYGRDAVGNINKITQTFAGETTVLMSDANYEPFGPLGYIEFGSTVDTSSVALHHRTAIDYDLAGRIYRQRRDIVANGVPSPLNSPEYQYDANSNIAHIADLYSTTLAPDSFEYDELDQLEVWTRGSDTPYTLKFEYDANGNRTKKLDGKWGWHQVLNIEPGSNRILEEVMQGITPEYHYDANGNELGIDAIPGISLVGYPNMEYGENNRLRRVLTHTGNSELASHLYNGLGQRTKKAGLSGAVYYYHYDVEGNLIAETDNFGDTIVEYIYLNQQPFAIVVDAESGIGTTPTFVSDPDGNGLVWRRWNNPNASGNQVLLSPPETKADPLTGSRANYSVTVANAGTYTLYVRGKGSDSTAATVYVTDSITGQVDDLSFATSSWQFKWRTHSIPISANANQTFDVTLIRRNRDTEVDVFVLSTDSQLSSSELDDLVGLAGSPSTLADTYTWEAEGTTPWVADAGDVYFYHNDHLGTPKLITDHSGTEVWRADNEPFRPRPAYPWAIDSNLVYPGQYYDTEGGISYNGFRHYSSRLGRYVQSDPIGLFGGLNTYSYVDNNPVNFIDPPGLMKFRPGTFTGGGPGGIGAFGGGGGRGGSSGGGTGGSSAPRPKIPPVLPPSPSGTGGGSNDIPDNVIPFPGPSSEEDGRFCPPAPGGGGESTCQFTKLAGVTLSGSYGQTIQCQYRCPRKGIRYFTRTIPYRSPNPRFLCPETRPESSFIP